MIAITLTSLFLILIFIALGIFNKFSMFKWASFILAFFEMFYLLGLLYGNEAGLNIVPLLQMNFIIFGIVGFGLVILSFTFKSISLMSFDEAAPNDLAKGKFSGGGKFEGNF